MDFTLVLTQFLNGLQLGVLLFLLAAGLTLVFGIMDCVNLAHGSLYMAGAFVCATVTLATDSFLLGILVALPATFAIGWWWSSSSSATSTSATTSTRCSPLSGSSSCSTPWCTSSGVRRA